MDPVLEVLRCDQLVLRRVVWLRCPRTTNCVCCAHHRSSTSSLPLSLTFASTFAFMSSSETDHYPLHTPAPHTRTDEEAARSKQLREERLNFPPLYVVVGVYRLCTDKNLYVPAWQKCKHGALRGAAVGAGWVSCLWRIRPWRS